MSQAISFRIKRGSGDQRSHWETHELAVADSTTLLDALLALRASSVPGLTFRAACRHGACGDCAMVANGTGVLACVSLVGPLGGTRRIVRVEPLRGMPVLRDLVVDRSRLFDALSASRPWLERSSPDPAREHAVAPEVLDRMHGADACILCGICMSACPVVQPRGAFPGPAPFLKTAGRVVDPRDDSGPRRLRQAHGLFGVARCRSALACSAQCPRELDPAGAIVDLKLRSPR